VPLGAIERFRNSIDPFLEDWNSIDLRVVAQLGTDDRWHFDSVGAILSRESLRAPLHQGLPSFPNLLVSHERWKKEKIGDLLDCIAKGELPIGKDVVHIKYQQGQEWKPYEIQDYQFRNRTRTRSEFGLEFATFALRIWGSVLFDNERLRRIDSALRSCEHPWDGLADLREHFVGLPFDTANRPDAAMADIIAPLNVRLGDDSTLNDRILKVSIVSDPALDSRHISLSVISTVSNGSTLRAQYSLKNKKRLLKIELPSRPAKADVIAIYRGVDVDRLEFSTSSNPRIALLEQLGLTLDAFQSRLENSQGRDFERWSSILLQSLGMSPGHFGGTNLDAPDIIAFSDDAEWLLVAECTVAEPDLGGKLTKLASRTKQIGTALKSMTVTPVLFTAKPRNLLNKTDVEKASKEQIAILTKDDIIDLLKMARETPQLEKLQKYVLSKIPHQVSAGPFG